MDSETKIECRVGVWFGRRMLILVALLSGTSLFFFYDGLIGYPNQNFDAALFAAFQSGKAGQGSGVGTAGFPSPDGFGLAVLSPKQETALNSAMEAGKQGETWAEFAATRHLSAAEPEKKSAAEIRGQKIYGAVLAVGVVLVLAFWVWERRKTIWCDGSMICFQNGQSVNFKDVESIDLTKWDRGIAVIQTSSGFTVKIDDYKFEGAGKIVDRLREKVPDLEITTAP